MGVFNQQKKKPKKEGINFSSWKKSAAIFKYLKPH
jgi:hypothetical protein